MVQVKMVKGKVRLRTSHEAEEEKGVEVELYSVFNLGTRLGWVVVLTTHFHLPLYTQERDPVFIV